MCWKASAGSAFALAGGLHQKAFTHAVLKDEFDTFFHRRVIFVLNSPEVYLDEAHCQAYAGVMRTFTNIEVKVSHHFLTKNLGSTHLKGFQLRERNVTTIVLSSKLLWEHLDLGRWRSSLESHRNLITALQDWQSAWHNSVITMAP